VNIVKSIGFIGEKGTNLEKARINCILHGSNPAQDAVKGLYQLQNEDGGFPFGMVIGNPSTINEDLVRWLGVALSAGGFTLAFLSGRALGRQYSADVTIQKEHQLITSDVYRLIRHPRYLGVIALSHGISCISQSWIGLVASVIFIVSFLYRISEEEDTLHKEFGKDLEMYCTYSWCFIPYVN